MKKFLIKITLVASLLLISKTSFSYVALSSFEIPSQHLLYGGLIYNVNGTARAFTATASFTQSGTTFNTIKVRLVLLENGVETILATAEKSAWTSGTIWDINLSGTVPAGRTTGKVVLRCQEFQGSSANGLQESTKAYQLIASNYTPPPAIYVPNPFGNIWLSDGVTPRYNIKRLPQYQTPPAPGSQNVWYPSVAGPVMTRGQEVYSPNGQFLLQFQASDGNLVLSKVSTGQALWASNKSNGQGLYFQADGNLIISTAAGQMIWTSDVYKVGGSYVVLPRLYLELQNDGNLVLKWNGGTFTDAIAAAGTGGGIVSSHYGQFK
jgi:hypothetical protein